MEEEKMSDFVNRLVGYSLAGLVIGTLWGLSGNPQNLIIWPFMGLLLGYYQGLRKSGFQWKDYPVQYRFSLSLTVCMIILSLLAHQFAGRPVFLVIIFSYLVIELVLCLFITKKEYFY